MYNVFVISTKYFVCGDDRGLVVGKNILILCSSKLTMLLAVVLLTVVYLAKECIDYFTCC